jgi:PAXNEB protein
MTVAPRMSCCRAAACWLQLCCIPQGSVASPIDVVTLHSVSHDLADPGTAPGPYGQTLVSTGLADMDRLLGGGLPLGGLLLVLEDSPPEVRGVPCL